jgi:hypothetical protein
MYNIKAHTLISVPGDLILLACNCHDELVEAVEAAVGIYVNLKLGGYKFNSDYLTKANAILAKARPIGSTRCEY